MSAAETALNLRDARTSISEKLPRSGRLLAIDYGRRRFGLAISDPLQMTSNPYGTRTAGKGGKILEQIERICQEENIAGVVVGKPLHMDGREGEMVSEAIAFARQVRERTGLPVTLWDERLTSQQAIRTLQAFGKKPSRDKKAVDRLAAFFLLQSYLEYRNR